MDIQYEETEDLEPVSKSSVSFGVWGNTCLLVGICR